VLRALPDLTGVTVYLTEGQTEVEKLPGREPSRMRRARKVIDTMWAVCINGFEQTAAGLDQRVGLSQSGWI
jgi:hypothetical protein